MSRTFFKNIFFIYRIRNPSLHASWGQLLWLKFNGHLPFCQTRTRNLSCHASWGLVPAATLQGGWAKRGTRKRETRIWNEKTATEGLVRWPTKRLKICVRFRVQSPHPDRERQLFLTQTFLQFRFYQNEDPCQELFFTSCLLSSGQARDGTGSGVW